MGIQINGQNDEIRAVDGSGIVRLDVEGNVTGQISGIQTSIQVGDKFINSSGVGLGTTSTAGFPAGGYPPPFPPPPI